MSDARRNYWKQKWNEIPLSCIEYPIQTVRMNCLMPTNCDNCKSNSVCRPSSVAKQRTNKPTPHYFWQNGNSRAFHEPMCQGQGHNQDVIMSICRASDCTPEAINLYLMRLALSKENNIFRREDPRNLLQEMLPPTISPSLPHVPFTLQLGGSGNEEFSCCMQHPKLQYQLQRQQQHQQHQLMLATHLRQSQRNNYFLPPKWLIDLENLYRSVASNMKPLSLPYDRSKKQRRNSENAKILFYPKNKWISLTTRANASTSRSVSRSVNYSVSSRDYQEFDDHDEFEEVPKPLPRLEQPGRHYYGGGVHRIEFIAPHRITFLGSQMLVRVGKKAPPPPPPPPTPPPPPPLPLPLPPSRPTTSDLMEFERFSRSNSTTRS